MHGCRNDDATRERNGVELGGGLACRKRSRTTTSIWEKHSEGVDHSSSLSLARPLALLDVQFIAMAE